MSEQKKKNNVAVLVIIIVLVLAIGGYAIWQTQSQNSNVSGKEPVSTIALTTTTQTTTSMPTTTTTTTTTQTTTESIEIIDINFDTLGEGIKKWLMMLPGDLEYSDKDVYAGDAIYQNKLVEFETYSGNVISAYVELGQLASLRYKFSFFGFDENTTKKEVENKYKSKKISNEDGKDCIIISTGEYKVAKFYFTNNKLSSGFVFYPD